MRIKGIGVVSPRAMTRSLTRIMHHESIFARLGRRSRGFDPSVWIGVMPLAVQRVWDGSALIGGASGPTAPRLTGRMA
jgi:hypothetical protein